MRNRPITAMVQTERGQSRFFVAGKPQELQGILTTLREEEARRDEAAAAYACSYELADSLRKHSSS
jgi:hypothetical protein